LGNTFGPNLNKMHILGNIPKEPFYIACSGGVDSMFMLDFLSRYPQNHFELLFFNHGTSDCHNAEAFLRRFCANKNFILHVGNANRVKDKKESQEEYWRCIRYDFLNRYIDRPILMAHNLDDAVESWVMSSIKGGNPILLPYRRNNIIRPFLTVSKKEIMSWALRSHLEWSQDQSNEDTVHLRNYIRHVAMPMILHMNPGIHSMIRRKIIERGV